MMMANYEENEVFAAIDECVKREFADVDQARNIAVFLALTLFNKPLVGIGSHYSMSEAEIDEARRGITAANSKDRLMASRVAGCRLAVWKKIEQVV